MKLRSRHIITIGTIITAALIAALVPQDIWARSGGGGRGGSGSGTDWEGVTYIVYFVGSFIYYLILSYVITGKFRESRALLDRLAKRDAIWNFDDIKQRIKITFFKVQEAWTKRDQSIAREYVSDHLFNFHKMQTDRMIEQKRINVLEDINLISVAVVQVADFIDDNKDSLWVYIKGEMIDYVMDENTKEEIEGNSGQPDKFKELWKFVRHPQRGWVLDEIDQNAKILEISRFHSFSEEAPLSRKQLRDCIAKEGKRSDRDWKPLSLKQFNFLDASIFAVCAFTMLPIILLIIFVAVSRSS